jgi:hypothetical protein|nr:MAG TPA: head to tail adaptor [Bacteriophage sp.]
MIMSIDELRQFITTDKTDLVLDAQLQALELLIRKYTNNNFQDRNRRFKCDVSSIGLLYASTLFKVGDTVQLSESAFNSGLYTIASIDLENGCMGLNEALTDESDVLVTKIFYPMDVKMGVVDIIRWKLKNEDINSGDTSKMNIQSETLSRHSVTYVQDSSETDIDGSFGVPKKYVAFLNAYKKARF